MSIENEASPANSQPVSSVESTVLLSVFEAINDSDDETYYTIAIYETLEQAIENITHGEDEIDFEPCCGESWGSEDHASVSIYERIIGEQRRGKKVWSRQWSQECPTDTDEPKWVVSLG